MQPPLAEVAMIESSFFRGLHCQLKSCAAVQRTANRILLDKWRGLDKESATGLGLRPGNYERCGVRFSAKNKTGATFSQEERMRCPTCKSENPASAKFSAECGAPFKSVCSKCGSESPPRLQILRRIR